jgi:hypothetical protein
MIMGLLGFIGAIAVMTGAWWWLALPRLRRLPWWDSFQHGAPVRLRDLAARAWALTGNSRTILAGYAAELLGILDEARLLDWSALVGAERAGRVMVVMGAVMIVLRLITRARVSFKSSFKPEA